MPLSSAARSRCCRRFARFTKRRKPAQSRWRGSPQSSIDCCANTAIEERHQPMRFPFYSGNPDAPAGEGPAQLPISRRAGQEDPRGYLPDPALIDAVNVALVLGQPLLLTGEPGTGKTQLAYSVASELGFKVLKFETKSTSTA